MAIDTSSPDWQYRFYRSREWRQARRQVLERDRYECQECKAQGRVGRGRVVHHIQHLDKRPDLALEPDNLLTVCESCHNFLQPEKFPEGRQAMRRWAIAPERW